jgi:hypothetical protein
LRAARHLCQLDPLPPQAQGIDALRAAYGPALGQASVGERINERLTQWQVAAGLELHASFPFELHENRLKDWRHRLRHEAPDPAHLPDVVADYMSCLQGHRSSGK